MIAKLKTALVAAAIALYAALGAALYLQTSRLDKARGEAILASQRASDLEDQVAGLERAQKALVAARNAARKEAARAHKELDNALKQDPGWAAAPVPDATLEWLRQHGYAAPAP